ncbi:WD40 repeat domain-containing protein, partial [Streptomyces sp. NPDC058291]|uniref:WD40 repeat domain-containing protein n=1 Tax=Streptomyces sp. NPDC058291 TaxID=3346427 RepID=UPI0036E434F9
MSRRSRRPRRRRAVEADSRTVAVAVRSLLPWSPPGDRLASAVFSPGARCRPPRAATATCTCGTPRRASTGARPCTGRPANPASCGRPRPTRRPQLAPAGDDRTVRPRGARTGRATAALTGHTGRVLAVSFSPDGSLLASGGEDG